MIERTIALVFLVLVFGFLLGRLGQAEPPPPPDYRNETINALQTRVNELEAKVAEWEKHHEAVHRGECVPRPDWQGGP